jgi:hypothetical protein
MSSITIIKSLSNCKCVDCKCNDQKVCKCIDCKCNDQKFCKCIDCKCIDCKCNDQKDKICDTDCYCKECEKL